MRHMKKIIFLLTCVIGSVLLFAQPRVISGPMLGPVELRDARVWVEVSPEVKAVALQYNKQGEKSGKTIQYKGLLGNEFNPLTFTIGGLDINTTYHQGSLAMA